MNEFRITQRMSLVFERKAGGMLVLWPALVWFPVGSDQEDATDLTLAWLVFGITLRVRSDEQ